MLPLGKPVFTTNAHACVAPPPPRYIGWCGCLHPSLDRQGQMGKDKEESCALRINVSGNIG